MRAPGLHPEPLRRRNLRLASVVLGVMALLYAISIIGVLVLN